MEKSGKNHLVSLDDLLKSKGLPDAAALAQWVASLSTKDCADALAALQKLPSGIQRNTIMGAVIAAWAKQDPKGYLGAASNITSPMLREVVPGPPPTPNPPSPGSTKIPAPSRPIPSAIASIRFLPAMP
jgi:hypothetical protein